MRSLSRPLRTCGASTVRSAAIGAAAGPRRDRQLVSRRGGRVAMKQRAAAAGEGKHREHGGEEVFHRGNSTPCEFDSYSSSAGFCFSDRDRSRISRTASRLSCSSRSSSGNP